jgi:hypothetical protein
MYTYIQVLFMPEIDQKVMGGTMRLGARPTTITPSLKNGTPSLAREVCTYIDMYCMSGVSCLRLSCCINSLNCCVHYTCLRGWVSVFYVGHIDKIMKPFSTLQS